jgi:hypothetical protein
MYVCACVCVCVRVCVYMHAVLLQLVQKFLYEMCDVCMFIGDVCVCVCACIHACMKYAEISVPGV